MTSPPLISCLTIAGSDSGGGAGIQADLKAFAALRCFGTSAITAVTAQDTTTVHSVVVIPPTDVSRQIEAVLSDSLNVRAVKTGMLPTREAVDAVAVALRDHVVSRALPLVVDPVMIAKGGAVLTPSATVTSIKSNLLPLAALCTPNVPEAEILAGMAIASRADAIVAAEKILSESSGLRAVLMKGGHATWQESDGDGESSLLEDILVIRGDFSSSCFKSFSFFRSRITTRNTHGTGCTLAAAIAAKLAHGLPLPTAVEEAGNYLHGAIVATSQMRLGNGHGPVDHFYLQNNNAHQHEQNQQLSRVTSKPNSFFSNIIFQIPTLLGRIRQHPFVAGAQRGTLSDGLFVRYLVQDEIYLMVYGDALQLLRDTAEAMTEILRRSGDDGEDNDNNVGGRRALSLDLVAATQFLVDACEDECTWHETFPVTDEAVAAAVPTDACQRYCEFLRRFMTPLAAAAADEQRRQEAGEDVWYFWCRLAAAILPCFWSYADLALFQQQQEQQQQRQQEHTPGASSTTVTINKTKCWIDFYASETAVGAAKVCAQLIDFCGEFNPAAARSNDVHDIHGDRQQQQQKCLTDIIVQGLIHEVDFFDASCQLRVGLYSYLPDTRRDNFAALRNRLAEEFFARSGVNVVVEFVDPDAAYDASSPAAMRAVMRYFDVAELDCLMHPSVAPFAEKWSFVSNSGGGDGGGGGECREADATGAGASASVAGGGAAANHHQQQQPVEENGSDDVLAGPWTLDAADFAALHGYAVPTKTCAIFLFASSASQAATSLLRSSADTLAFCRGARHEQRSVAWNIKSATFLMSLAYALEPAAFASVSTSSLSSAPSASSSVAVATLSEETLTLVRAIRDVPREDFHAQHHVDSPLGRVPRLGGAFENENDINGNVNNNSNNAISNDCVPIVAGYSEVLGEASLTPPGVARPFLFKAPNEEEEQQREGQPKAQLYVDALYLSKLRIRSDHHNSAAKAAACREWARYFSSLRTALWMSKGEDDFVENFNENCNENNSTAAASCADSAATRRRRYLLPARPITAGGDGGSDEAGGWLSDATFATVWRQVQGMTMVPPRLYARRREICSAIDEML